MAVLNSPDTLVGDVGTCLGSSWRMASSVLLSSFVVYFVSPIIYIYIYRERERERVREKERERKRKKNDTSTIFSQQILSGMLLLVIIVRAKK